MLSLTDCGRVQGWQHASAPHRKPLPPFLMQAASSGAAQHQCRLFSPPALKQEGRRRSPAGPLSAAWFGRDGRQPGCWSLRLRLVPSPVLLAPHLSTVGPVSTADMARAAPGKLLPWQTTGSAVSAWLTTPGSEVGATLPCAESKACAGLHGCLVAGGVGCAGDLGTAGQGSPVTARDTGRQQRMEGSRQRHRCPAARRRPAPSGRP